MQQWQPLQSFKPSPRGELQAREDPVSRLYKDQADQRFESIQQGQQKQRLLIEQQSQQQNQEQLFEIPQSRTFYDPQTDPQAIASVRLQLQQQQRARQLMAQQALEADLQTSGIPMNMTEFSQLNPQQLHQLRRGLAPGQHPQAQAIMAQQLALQQQHEQQQAAHAQQMQAGPNPGQPMRTAQTIQAIRQNQLALQNQMAKIEQQKQPVRQQRLGQTGQVAGLSSRIPPGSDDLVASSTAQKGTAVPYTIAQDRTKGERAHQLRLLADYGKKCHSRDSTSKVLNGRITRRSESKRSTIQDERFMSL
ncbi:hypothetical protein RAB80_009191 [Fusarium oxysporum f. sp. vasinfectum]|uniref:Uncharacterized protein n=1 Tax=Fusarium oxysporum f. sp. vasinfectum 25433 TaxID=1089449 RepID=X0MIW1_FUSOX|nr:hypothetical protein FOTG_11638 [Fusarium oxysporum f. sp. vasinfectum 25433]KAK2674207.1 hypothetical protein RAB80_009191 [Fusarium oxysporum f. sp. vasinfectum]KAK2930642.1 hypothetical protein FoTM2_008152 [Fusarium oxysporum f. sp. vasinfectum]